MIIIIIITGVKNRLESFSRDIKEVKASQDEIKNAINEPRMDATVARIDEAEQKSAIQRTNLWRIMKHKKRGKLWQNSTIQELENSVTH